MASGRRRIAAGRDFLLGKPDSAQCVAAAVALDDSPVAAGKRERLGTGQGIRKRRRHFDQRIGGQSRAAADPAVEPDQARAQDGVVRGRAARALVGERASREAARAAGEAQQPKRGFGPLQRLVRRPGNFPVAVIGVSRGALSVIAGRLVLAVELEDRQRKPRRRRAAGVQHDRERKAPELRKTMSANSINYHLAR